MSDRSPYDTLGVTKDASFDEIQEAKNRLVQQFSDDRKQAETIEAAYDAVLMDRLRMRQEGKIKVPDRIRFPERSTQQTSPVSPKPPENPAPAWAQSLLDTPSQKDILYPAMLFAGLGILSIAFQSDDGAMQQLALALGVVSSLYFLNRKEQRFGRAFLITLAGLILGLLVGSLLGSALDQPLQSLKLTQENFVTLVTLFDLWLVSSFLK